MQTKSPSQKHCIELGSHGQKTLQGDVSTQDAQSQNSQATITLAVSAMKCAGCVKAVEKKLAEHPEVVDASVNLVTSKATITADCFPNDQPQLADTLAENLTSMGFPSHIESLSNDDFDFPDSSSAPFSSSAPPLNETIEEQTSSIKTTGKVSPLAIAIALLVLSVIGHFKHWGWLEVPVLSNIWFHCGLATVALVWPGRGILMDGWRGLRHGIPNMNTLVGIGMVVSYWASIIALLKPSLGWECFFDEPVMLVGFILLGRTLEHRARKRAFQAIESLFSLQPKTAQLLLSNEKNLKDIDSFNMSSPEATRNSSFELENLTNMNITEILAQDVQPGQYLRVLPGEQIPVDGVVVVGRTTVDESMLTGESEPVTKTQNDCVISGSLNQSGGIAIQATRVGRDTTLARIIKLVEDAQTRKAPVQKLVDIVAGYFAYGVITISFVTFLFWYFVGTQLWPGVLMHNAYVVHHEAMTGETSPLLLSIKLAIAVLVVACPCALGLATPMAILVGSGIGAEKGLLIRGGDVLERLHKLDILVFDKTGTLTTGKPTVKKVQSLCPDVSEDTVLRLAASVEQGSSHPMAHAIQHASQKRSLQLFPTKDVQTDIGNGVTAIVNDAAVYVGKPSWIQTQLPWDESTNYLIETFEQQYNGSLVLVASDNRLVGILSIDDPLREDAKASIAQLKSMNIGIYVLTGDRQSAALPIVKQLELSSDDLIAEVHPAQKADMIKTLQQGQQIVGMVGDGINDAPALAQADVGIAMQSGTDVAMETSDIVLMRDRLSDVAESIQLGRQVFNKIRQNLFWALSYNTLGIPIAAGILLPTWGILLSPANAGAIMAFSSVSVVANALLLRRSISIRPNQ